MSMEFHLCLYELFRACRVRARVVEGLGSTSCALRDTERSVEALSDFPSSGLSVLSVASVY